MSSERSKVRTAVEFVAFSKGLSDSVSHNSYNSRLYRAWKKDKPVGIAYMRGYTLGEAMARNIRIDETARNFDYL